MQSLIKRLRDCSDLQSALDCALSGSLELTGADLGNVQVMDWKTGCLTIAAQRGFNGEFLSFFHRVTAEDGSACGRSIKDRTSIVIEDVMLDGQFAPYRTIALEAGFRAVQSTPIISRSGAFFGVISTHFPVTHRPSDREMLEMRALGEMTADAIIRQRIEGKGADGRSLTSTEKVARQISRAYEALADSYELLRHVTYQ